MLSFPELQPNPKIMNNLEQNSSLRDRLQQLVLEEGIDLDAAFPQLQHRYIELAGEVQHSTKLHQQGDREEDIVHMFAIDLACSAGILAQRERYDEANTCFEKALEILPQNPAILSAYMRFLISTERHEEALSVLERTIQASSYDDERKLLLLDSVIEPDECEQEDTSYSPEKDKIIGLFAGSPNLATDAEKILYERWAE